MTLDLISINAGYGGENVLKDISLSIHNGEILALVGENGSGKSTLLRVIAQLLRPHSGVCRWNERETRLIPSGEWAKICAFLPQEAGKPAELTVEELAYLGRWPHRKRFWGRDSVRDKAAVERALKVCDCFHLRHRRADSISGGERQRAWLAMAVAREPQLLLLDEPTAFLDLRHQCGLSDLLRRLNEETGLTMAVVLHDLTLAARLARRMAVMKNGALWKIGLPRDILTPQVLSEGFGVQADVGVSSDGKPYCVARRQDSE